VRRFSSLPPGLPRSGLGEDIEALHHTDILVLQNMAMRDNGSHRYGVIMGNELDRTIGYATATMGPTVMGS